MFCIRHFIATGLVLLTCLLTSWQTMAQAIADDEILPERQMPAEAPGKADQAETVSAPSGSLAGVTVEFVKKDEILPAGVMFFNVFKIQNTSGETVSFTPAFDIPPRTSLMLQDADKGQIQLNPGEAKFMPVRVSFPADAEGGVPYTVTGTLVGANDTKGASTTAKIQFERLSKWQISTPLAKIYASSVSEDYTPVTFFLSNKGNSAEQINLLFEAGELLKLEGEINGTLVLDVPLRPSTDTVVIVNVLSKPFEEEGSAGDKSRIVVMAKSHPDSAARELTITFDTKDGAFRNEINDDSPLYVGISQSDIGGEGSNTSIEVGGTILYEGDRHFKYQFNTQHNFFGGKEEYDPLKSSQFRVEYATPEKSFQAGFSGGSLGVAYSRKKEEESYRGSIVQNLKTGAFDLSGGYRKQLTRTISGTTGLNIRSDAASGSHSAVADVGANIALAENQRLSFKTTGTYGKTTHESGTVFKKAGIAYDWEYDLEMGRLKLNVSNAFASRNYHGSDRGTFRIEGDAVYEVRPGNFLKVGYTNNTKKTDGISKDGTIGNRKTGKQQKLSANYNFSVGNMPFAVGGNYSETSMHNEIYSLDTAVWSANRSYGLSLGTTVSSRSNGDFQLSPSIQVGMAQFAKGSWQDTPEKPTGYNAKMSLKGRVKQVSLSADYEILATPGERGDVFGNGQSLKKRFQFAASYMYPLIADKLILNTSGGMGYDMSTNEMKTEATASLDYESGRNWSFSIATNLDPLGMFGKSAEKSNTTVSVSARRTFDIPQPRLKYYNIKLLFFKDFNGNREIDDEDEGIGNVLVEIQRMADPVDTVGGQPEIKFEAPGLMSDPEGKVVFYKAPQGSYLLSLEELFPPMTYTNLYGESLEVTLNKHTTVLVPYTESVTVTGKVHIKRDKYSRLVGINAKNIRVTVTDAMGDQYHTLTSPSGEYIISVPVSEQFKVSMKNVLGDKFELPDADQEIKVEEGGRRYEIDFHFKEKGRSVNFGG